MARILVVDDEEGAREALAALLRRHGHEVTVPSCSRAAVARALRGDFDTAVITMFQPGIDGLEILKTVRARHAAARVICLCGGSPLMPDDSAVQVCLALGASASLRKPVAAAEILALVDAPQPAG